MVVLAPISQSSPTTTPPSCGTLSQRPASIARPKPSAPSTAPGWMSTRWPSRTRVTRVTRATSSLPAPTTQSSPMTQPGPTIAPASTRLRAPMLTNGPTWACGSTLAVGVDRRRRDGRPARAAGAARTGPTSWRRRRRDRARAGRCRRNRRHRPRASPRRPRWLSRQLAAVLRIGEERQLLRPGLGQRADAVDARARRRPARCRAKRSASSAALKDGRCMLGSRAGVVRTCRRR